MHCFIVSLFFLRMVQLFLSLRTLLYPASAHLCVYETLCRARASAVALYTQKLAALCSECPIKTQPLSKWKSEVLQFSTSFYWEERQRKTPTVRTKHTIVGPHSKTMKMGWRTSACHYPNIKARGTLLKFMRYSPGFLTICQGSSAYLNCVP